MAFNYSRLRGKIVEKYNSQGSFSQAIGLSEHSLSKKMTGKVGWKQAEMEKACEVLDIPLSRIPYYFFHRI